VCFERQKGKVGSTRDKGNQRIFEKKRRRYPSIHKFKARYVFLRRTARRATYVWETVRVGEAEPFEFQARPKVGFSHGHFEGAYPRSLVYQISIETLLVHFSDDCRDNMIPIRSTNATEIQIF
jgi:hypothetical protein